MSALLDIKYALRLLFKAPKFTALTLIVLIGGLSISLFTFSFLNSLIYRSIPFPDSDTALRVEASLDGDDISVSGYEFIQVRDQLTSFSEIGAYRDKFIRLSIADSGKNIRASYVEPGFFKFSRTQVELGRELQLADMQADSPPVVVISHELWKNNFDAHVNAIGQLLTLNNVSTTIVGIMPPSYVFPHNSKVWLPLTTKQLPPASTAAETRFNVYARINPNVSLTQAETELNNAMDVVYQQNVELYDKKAGQLDIKLRPYGSIRNGTEITLILGFFNLVAFFILLLACINVGNLLLARAIERQKETAIRAALGAPTKRLILQLMWEGILISCLGSLLSILLVAGALDYTDLAMHSYLPGIPDWVRWGMNLPTFLMAIVFTAVTLFLASFLPAWRAAKQDINATLRDGTRGAQGKKVGRMSRFMVTAQVAIISVLMLIGSLAAFISDQLLNLDIGIDYTQVMQATMELDEDRYSQSQQQSVFYQDLLVRLKQQPNVSHALAERYLGKGLLSINGIDYARDEDRPQVMTLSVIGNTEFYGARLLEGRHLDTRDKPEAAKTALVSQSFVKRYWPQKSAIDKRIQLTIDGQIEHLIIVGVVSNSLNGSPFSSKDAEDEIYVSGLQFVRPTQSVVFKYHGDQDKAEEAFYQSLYTKDRNLRPTKLEPALKEFDMMKDMLKYASKLIFMAGGFALLLALTGIYGLTANSVAQRTHEIGIRRAVGATDRQVVSMFLKQGVRQLIIGLGIGLTIYSLMLFIFHNISDGLLPWHLYIWVGLAVILGLTSVIMAAIYAPTRQAISVEPSAALRYE